MAVNYARTEIRLSRESRAKLLRLRDDMADETGRRVSLGEVIVGILDLFLERSPPRDPSGDPACNLPAKR